MNSPPNSLASLLSTVPNAYQNAQQAQAEEGNHDAIIMTYLRDTYEHVEDTSQNRYFGNGYRPSAGPSRPSLPTTAPAPPSPPDPTVPIPAALADIAAPYANLTDGPFTISLPPAVGLDEAFTDTLDRGEMGGKRRKPPHERAGWKEMDDGKRGEKRRHDEIADEEGHGHQHQNNGQSQSPSQVTHGQGQAEAQKETEGEAANAAEAAATLIGFEAIAPAPPAGGEGQSESVEGEVDGEGKPAKRQQKSKEARAEQNRKAQQIFRRKREEKIKQLELDSMALANTRQRLHAAEQRLQDMALELEAKMIEAQGLRRALSTAVSVTGVSLVRNDGTLVLSPEDYEHRDKTKIAAVHVEVGCDTLARASRQLAKANRQRRDDIRAAQEAAQHPPQA